MTTVMSWGQETILTANGDGTWTLAAMPAYNVELVVEYEDDDTPSPIEGIDLIDNGDGTWTLAEMPAFNVELLVEYEDDPDIIVSPLGETKEGAIFNINGQLVGKPQRGINIIRMSDDTTRKVLIK